MSTPEYEPFEDDEEWLPPRRHRPLMVVVIIGAVVVVALLVAGGVAFVYGFGDGSVTVPTATAPAEVYATDTNSGMMPEMMCDEAVQKIEHNQIAYVLIYRQKEGGPATPANAVNLIEVLPRGISYQGDPTQSVPLDFLAIETTYPDQTCYPQVLAAVKHINKTLSRRQQVKVVWQYALGG